MFQIRRKNTLQLWNCVRCYAPPPFLFSPFISFFNSKERLKKQKYLEKFNYVGNERTINSTQHTTNNAYCMAQNTPHYYYVFIATS